MPKGTFHLFSYNLQGDPQVYPCFEIVLCLLNFFPFWNFWLAGKILILSKGFVSTLYKIGRFKEVQSCQNQHDGVEK